jgi:aspartate/methionine/tyrosine aminotransferase
MFSSRVPGQLEPNRLTKAVDRARREGRRLIDLTLTNPTAAGIPYPDDLLRSLDAPAGRMYTPSPYGLDGARAAVSRDYSRRGYSIPMERIVLTASTSEAYSLLFKLLCEPSGDAVLVPAPSYPLFEHLTRLDGVAARPYRLEYQGRWLLDTQSVDEVWDGRVRGVLAVSPNNPTGSCLSAAELDWLGRRCAAAGAALIVDEVFADYPIADGLPVWEPRDEGLVFRLGGLSKSVGLPQVKLAWIAVQGSAPRACEALARLEVICDTYLSVATAVQVAAPELLERGAAVRAAILARVLENVAALQRLAAPHPSVTVLPVDAGWSAVLRVPARGTEEDLVVDLADSCGVLVHPGFFFDFAHEAFVVVSLLPDPPEFAEGVRRLLERVDA